MSNWIPERRARQAEVIRTWAPWNARRGPREPRSAAVLERAALKAARWPSRFWPKVEVRGLDECWPWRASLDTQGYGQFWRDGRLRMAHRIAHEQTRGEISPGLEVLHRCDNPRCCNPIHLAQGTHLENMQDMAAKGRHVAGRRKRSL